PTDQLVCLGDAVSFDAVATGVNLTYQWRIGLINLIDDARISGSNGPTLTIDPTELSDAATNYNVVVSGDFMPDVTSDDVELAFMSAPLIVTQPTDQTVCLGDAVTFDVVASGTNLSYQWRRGLVDLTDNASISGSQTASLTIDPTSTLDVATNCSSSNLGDFMPDVTSDDVELAFMSAPLIVTQPTDQAVCLGDAVTFDVVASGTNLSYQ